MSFELDKYLAHDYGINPEKPKVFAAWRESHQPFHWFAEFYGVMREGGFDVVIGHPPFVEFTPKNVDYKLPPTQQLATSACGNLYAFVAERCFSLCVQTGKFSFIMPSASLCTPRMAPLFDSTLKRYSLVAVSLWDERPSKLFDGVDQQLAIFVCGKDARNEKTLCLSAMRHWTASERAVLFETQSYIHVPTSFREAHVSPKLASTLEMKLLIRLKNRQVKPVKTGKTLPIFYKNAGGRYWRLVKSFPTFFSSETGATQTSTEKTKEVDASEAKIFVALYSSTIFYWYWRVVSNCRHLTEREFDAFPLKPRVFGDSEKKDLLRLGQEYEKDIKKNAIRLTTLNKRTGLIQQDSFKLSASKPIIDKIDLTLAKAYGFTDEETDFIINYDIKYRMGGADEEE